MAQTIGAKLPDGLVEHLDKQASHHRVSRSAVIRAYLITMARNPDIVDLDEIRRQRQKDAVELAKDDNDSRELPFLAQHQAPRYNG
jgi:metal-responsive CopG/Arc/MetJ family transcriptional regulator